MATPANSLKLAQNIPYDVLITHLRELSGTFINLVFMSKILIGTGNGDPCEFPQTHTKHPP